MRLATIAMRQLVLLHLHNLVLQNDTLISHTIGTLCLQLKMGPDQALALRSGDAGGMS